MAAGHKNSIYLNDDLQNYLEDQLKFFGMGKSAFISMVLTLYRQQGQALTQLSKMGEYIKDLKSLDKKQLSDMFKDKK